MKNILLPFDDSASANRAVQYLIDLSKQQPGMGLHVHVLNVQPSHRLYGRNALAADVQRQIEAAALENANEIASKAVAALTAAGVACTSHVEVGDILPQINRAIEQNYCDTVVMGTRGMGGLGNLVLGSTATNVVHGVNIPVLLIK